MKKKPPANSRLSWMGYYIKQYNKTQTESSACMAMWYQLLYLAFGEDTAPNHPDFTLEAISIGVNHWVVKPKDQLGTCGWLHGKAWKAKLSHAHTPERAIQSARDSVYM